jgi:hypothetical protein
MGGEFQHPPTSPFALDSGLGSLLLAVTLARLNFDSCILFSEFLLS